MVSWSRVFKGLFPLIDKQGEATYFSGSRFIQKIQEIDPYLPSYGDYIKERRSNLQSTTRRDFFYDILMQLDEASRVKVVLRILDEVGHSDPNRASELRNMLGGGMGSPSASIPASAWNASRLNECLADIEGAIATREYERAVSLSYTCLEGFLGAFVRSKCERDSYPNEIIELAKLVREQIKSLIPNYPSEVLNIITHSAYAVNKVRNRFSESHFGDEAGLWLAIFIRDIVNTQIRLLLHFM